ncbi:sulfite exporter TauE/SafE family protein [Thiosocius teredinicola]|uniref:sulfite exporter TauE/SafE family protein n=1 Tax=Thiosocius teredinicola TaxID=1973002 RepID=UPI002FE44AFA
MSGLEMLAAAAAVFAAYLVRGVSGFGSALIAVPLLVHVFPLTFVVPFMAVMDVIAAVFLTGAGLRDRRVRWREVGWLIPTTVAGIAIGLLLLVGMDGQALQLALGIFVVAFGLRNLLGLQAHKIVSPWWSIPAGLVGGGIGAVFSTGGPPYVIYLSHRLADKGELRATMSAIFLLDGSIRIVGLLIAGLLLQPQLGWFLLAGLPLMAAGLYVGHHIHVGLSQRQMTIVVALLLLVSGGSLIYRMLPDFW